MWLKSMIMIKCSVFFILVSLFIHQAQANNSDKQINWNQSDWPPFMISKGQNAGQGQLDKLWALIIREMPDYQHHKVVMNWSRIYKTMQSGEPLCNISAYKTKERETFAYFSRANNLILPHAVIIRKSDWVKLGSPKSYDLNKLLLNNNWVGQVESLRSYGLEIDKLIKQNTSNISFSTAQANRLIKMLINNRIDYFIEYPLIVDYVYQQEFSQPSDEELVYLKINEAPQYLLGYTACTKSPWGKKVIESVDIAIEKLISTPGYQSALSAWLSNASQAEYQQLYQQTLISKTK